MPSKTGVEVNVIEWTEGKKEVAIHFRDIDTLLTIDAEGARHLAFLLVECADYIAPPNLDSESPEDPESNQESLTIFGPYIQEIEEIEDGEEDDDEKDAS